MVCTRDETDGHIRIRVERRLSIYEVVGLREELMECLESDASVDLDLSDVADCDTAGLQLLYAAQKSAALRGKEFHISGAPQVLIEALKDAGLGESEKHILTRDVPATPVRPLAESWESSKLKAGTAQS